jgi:hypothetical protein
MSKNYPDYMRPFAIQLDISHEATKEQVESFAALFNCDAEMIMEVGPAGGNPVYEFTSVSFTDLERLEAEYNNVNRL